MAEKNNNKMIEEVWLPVLGFIAGIVLLIGTGIVSIIIALIIITVLFLINAKDRRFMRSLMNFLSLPESRF